MNAESSDFEARLIAIHQTIRKARSLKTVMPEIQRPLLELLQATRMTIYQCVRNGREIVASLTSLPEEQEIRVPFSATSIAGYVALSQRPLRIDDVYDDRELAAIHPMLRFDRRFSEAAGLAVCSMIAAPIRSGKVLLGVLQLFNLKDGPPFTQADLKRAMLVAQMLGRQFHDELKSTQGPFDLLVQQGRISARQLEDYEQRAARERTTVTRLLVEEAQAAPAAIGESLEHYYQVPFLGYEPARQLPVELLKYLNLDYLRANRWVPVGGDLDQAIVLMDDPSDYARVMEIQRVLGARSYAFRVGLPEDILRYLDHGGGRRGAEKLDEIVVRMEAERAAPRAERAQPTVTDPEDHSATIALVNKIIFETHRLGGSDIHIEPGRENQPAVVRIRVDGVCRELLKIRAGLSAPLVARVKVMANLDIAERRKPQDGKIRHRMPDTDLELRVATLPTVNGESVVLRLLNPGGALPLEKLQLAEATLAGILQAVAHPHGLFLVVGPTGSGKTTTLHAILAHLNQPERKIWTAEDPVEITQPGLQQLQIRPKIGLDFAAAMRAFLRADPDVILIGEMRDPETAGIAVEASLTGHLVLSTLHTNSAPETIVRLLDLGLDPINFSDALLGVLAQRLMRTLCERCKKPYTPEAGELTRLIRACGEAEFEALGIDRSAVVLHRAGGCEQCGGSGYKGRIGIHELLPATPEVKRLIHKGAEVAVLREAAVRAGMQTLLQNGARKVLEGHSDFQHLLKVVAT